MVNSTHVMSWVQDSVLCVLSLWLSSIYKEYGNRELLTMTSRRFGAVKVIQLVPYSMAPFKILMKTIAKSNIVKFNGKSTSFRIAIIVFSIFHGSFHGFFSAAACYDAYPSQPRGMILSNWRRFRGVGGEHQLCLLLNPPSGKPTNSYWKWPFIVDLPIKNGDFP